jgi:hypothetical protein
MEILYYVIAAFISTGHAAFCAVVWIVALASAAYRAGSREIRTRIWLTHAGIALLLSAAFPWLLIIYINLSALASDYSYARADSRREEWIKTLPAIAPSRAREALDAIFAAMPAQDLKAHNEVVQRVTESLASPDAEWTASDLQAFDHVYQRLLEASRDPHIHNVVAPPAFNPLLGITTWHRQREDLAGADAACARYGSWDFEVRNCRLMLHDAVCGWCEGNTERCVELAAQPSFGPTAKALDIQPHCMTTQGHAPIR